ncbi:hypothetical protein PoHVEF18_001673 [Penicillium ochrochloron]
MDNTVGLRESLSLDPNSKPHHDLGLTLSPGSQPQLAVPCSNDAEDVDDLASLFEMDDDFDPFSDFGKLAHQADPKHGCKKRTSDAAFEGDIELSPSKRQNQEQHVSVAAETFTQPPDIHPTSRDSIRSFPSHSPFLTSEAPASASPAIKNTFKLNQESLARIAAVEAFTHGKLSSTHISPYAPVGYYPSTPNLHCMSGGEGDSNEALKSRLDSSRRRINVVIAERNKYRDALLKYELVDPETGMLGVQKLESEVLRLRRLASNHRYRMDQLKAEAQEWKDRYAALGTTHNCLIRDYQTLQATTCLPPSTGEAPREAPAAAFTSPPNNIQGSYEQLSQAFTVLYAAYPATMATNYANSIFSGPRGYMPPISPEEAAILLQQAGIPFFLPAGNPVAAHQAQGPAMTTTAPPAPTVPPKDIVVIDLTGDSDTEVSPQGSHTQSPTPLLTHDPSPLTDFRRRFRKKKLTWLHESNSQEADYEIADSLCKKLNSRKRKRVLGKKFVETTWARCYGHVQSKKHVRWVLGGPLSPLTGVPSSSPVAAEGDTASHSISDDEDFDEFARMLEESLSRGKTPEEEGIAANTTTSPPSGRSCLDVEAKGDPPEPYSITDDEFAQMLEESLARGKTPE